MKEPISNLTALLQNVAAISAHFHMHGDIHEFRDLFPDSAYDLCIGMAQAFADWEKHCGCSDQLDWITVIESYVDAVIAQMIEIEEDVNVIYVLRQLPTIKSIEAAT
jgi:hypothetical protein